MKRKLELKDICHYLPYKLQCHSIGYIEDEEPEILTVCRIDADDDEYNVAIEDDFGDVYWVAIEDVFPILHPISDVIKPITVKGYNDDKLFVPEFEICRIFSPEDLKWLEKDYNNNKLGIDMSLVDKIPYKEAELLYQWHFDLNNLIADGLAVDINTLR